MVGLYVVEKIVHVTPTKKDDIVWDMLIKPVFDKVKKVIGK